jgi:hypothetical protein
MPEIFQRFRVEDTFSKRADVCLLHGDALETASDLRCVEHLGFGVTH